MSEATKGRSRARTLKAVALAVGVATAVAGAVTGAAGTTPNRIGPGQRVDVRVLLVSADGTEPGFGAWKAQLAREGVPFDTFVAYNGTAKTALTDARLADYAADHARYSAIVLSTGDLGHNVANPGGTTSYLSALTDDEWAALAKFERSFGIRQVSDYTAPSPAHGLTTVGGANQDGLTGTLTPTGKAAFPYLKGPVPIADDDPTVAEAFGYQATPAVAGDWQTLLAGPNGTAYLGIYTHPADGREEMVTTVAGNENQSHVQLLRHGMLTWVTRGVFLGFQRHYLELQVDDLFLGDDAWDPATHTTSYDPATASRMTAGDVRQAVAWSKARAIRIDFAFNGGGSALWLQQVNGDADPANDTTSDPLAAAFADTATRNTFGFINHTFEHPNIDCSTASFIAAQISQNAAWARARSLPLDPAEVITGEHSGLANSRPGNPGTIDPPSIDDAEPLTATGTGMPAGSYDYALTARSAAGETIASELPAVAVVAPANAVRVSFGAVCHAVTYTLYRRTATTGAWSVVGTLNRSATAPTDDGSAQIALSITDAAATGTAGTPPTANGAAIAPYGQNPNYLAGLVAAGVRYTATDASKTYPVVPTDVAGAQLAAGATFTEGVSPAGFQTVPRYPTNVYYNVSRQAQQLDEYNWIYVAPANGGACVAIPQVTTCRTTPATWDEYVKREGDVMFRHLMGNDPRPHFMHQSNMADFDPGLPAVAPNQGGILYPVVDGLLQRYDAGIDRAGAPLIQLTSTEIAETLRRQATWAANLAAGKVTAWLQDGRLHVRNADAAAIEVPLTGTTVGDRYGGARSGWTTIPAATEQVFAPDDPVATVAPAVTGTAEVGRTLTASDGTWTGTATIDHGHQWQRCGADGAGCASIEGATAPTYELAAADEGRRLRVVVSGGNWISSVSQSASAMTAIVAKAPEPPASQKAGESGGGSAKGGGGGAGSRGDGGGSAGGRSGGASSRLALTKLTMSPRSFAVAHRRLPRGTRLDGSRITWRLSGPATVRLAVQRRTGAGKHRRWVTVGVLRRPAATGQGVLRFTGRFGRRLLAPGAYRLAATAASGGHTTRAVHVAFRVVRG